MKRKTGLETSNNPNRKSQKEVKYRENGKILRKAVYVRFLKRQFLSSLGIFKPSCRFKWWGWRVASVTEVILRDFKSYLGSFFYKKEVLISRNSLIIQSGFDLVLSYSNLRCRDIYLLISNYGFHFYSIFGAPFEIFSQEIKINWINKQNVFALTNCRLTLVDYLRQPTHFAVKKLESDLTCTPKITWLQ